MKNSKKTSLKFFMALATFISIINGSVAQAGIGDIAPQFVVDDKDGHTHNLYEYLADGKTVFLKVGYIGCLTCDLTVPGTNDLYLNNGCNTGDLIVLDITWNTTAQLEDYISISENFYGPWPGPFNVPMEVALYPEHPGDDPGGKFQEILDDYGILGVAAFIIIAPDSTIAGRFDPVVQYPSSSAYESIGDLDNGVSISEITKFLEDSLGIYGGIASANMGSYSGDYTEFCSTTTSIDEHSIEEASIYPNPADNIMTIEIKDEMVNGEIVVYNLFGEVVLRQKILSVNDMKSPVDFLPSGTYGLSIFNNLNVAIAKTKLVIVH